MSSPPTDGVAAPFRPLAQLSLVHHTKVDVQHWVANLPIMNFIETGRQLYQTLSELPQLNISEELRFELLEIIEPGVLNLVKTLGKHLLNQPVLLTHQALRIFSLIQALHHHMGINYKVVVIDCLRKLRQDKIGFMDMGRKGVKQLAATAMQRMLASFTRELLHVYRQYALVPAQVWQEIHGLFRIALDQNFIDLPVKNRVPLLPVETSVRESYLQAVLLGGSQTNKLRQHEIDVLYQYSHLLADHLTVVDAPINALLICNLEDCPPRYRHQTQMTPRSWFIQSHKLLAFLDKDSNLQQKLPASLLMHLAEVWREGKERLFDRRIAEKHLLICLGLSAAHFYVGGEARFTHIVQWMDKDLAPDLISKPKISQTVPAFLFGPEDEDTLQEEVPDAWEISYTTVESIEQEKQKIAQKQAKDKNKEESDTEREISYSTYRVAAVNASTGGYGVIWHETPPQNLRPGELVGVNEGKGWHIAILHWVQQLPDRQIEGGIELLSTRARPCGVALVSQERGQSEFLRGFLIPEMKSLEQPPTLITSAAVFAVGSTVLISMNEDCVQATLTRLVLATASISRFEFALVGIEAEPTPAPVSNLDHEALWNQL